ncbi:MAG: DUF2442 domain-containing protein [bacterium]
MTEWPQIESVSFSTDFHIIARFSNGDQKLFAMAPLLDSEVYKRLNDFEYFKTGKIRYRDFIEWPNGEDLHKDTLYARGVDIVQAAAA